MKKLFFLSIILISLSCENDNYEPYNEEVEASTNDKVEALTPMKFSPEVLDYLSKSHHAAKIRNNNNDRPYWVAMYSDFLPDFEVFYTLPVPNTDMVMYFKVPTDGMDRALVKGDWIMTNWNVLKPYIFIADFSAGPPSVIYSNWCEEDRTGHWQIQFRGQLSEFDLDGDGLTDIWEPDFANGGGSTKTDVTDSQIANPGEFPSLGNCEVATTKIGVQGTIRVKDGVSKINVLLDGVRYKNF